MPALLPRQLIQRWFLQAAISALASSSSCAIFSDELNHASIIDGARLAKAAGAQLHIYRHNDMEHLDRLLSASTAAYRKLVITDSLFSMDGPQLSLVPQNFNQS